MSSQSCVFERNLNLLPPDNGISETSDVDVVNLGRQAAGLLDSVGTYEEIKCIEMIFLEIDIRRNRIGPMTILLTLICYLRRMKKFHQNVLKILL